MAPRTGKYGLITKKPKRDTLSDVGIFKDDSKNMDDIERVNAELVASSNKRSLVQNENQDISEVYDYDNSYDDFRKEHHTSLNTVENTKVKYLNT